MLGCFFLYIFLCSSKWTVNKYKVNRYYFTRIVAPIKFQKETSSKNEIEENMKKFARNNFQMVSPGGQFCSSLLSIQSATLSHRNFDEIQKPFLHRNSPERQSGIWLVVLNPRKQSYKSNMQMNNRQDKIEEAWFSNAN